MFENADLHRTDFDARSCYRTRHKFVWRTGEHSNVLTQIIDDFLAVWNYGKLSAKFL